MKAKTKAELKEEIQMMRDRMKGIVHRCGMNYFDIKDKPEGYYKGRLAMIHRVAKEFVD